MKELIKKYVPGATILWRKIYRLYIYEKSKRTKLVFTEKFLKNGWGSEESVSGYGSELNQTRVILKRLPALLEKYKVKSLLDIPCGDLNWMRHLNYRFEKYTGADIVKEIIERNKSVYPHFGEFMVLDILRNPLPKADVIFCRDCLVHFSYADVKKAIENIKKSGSGYLITTTYQKTSNHDILTGDWRPLNLQAEPFLLPPPLEIFNEESIEIGARGDKWLGMWLIKDL